MIQIDMEMPEKCGLCPLFHAEHPMYCQGVKADRKKKIVAPYRDPRPEWCPIPEIQPDPDTVSRKAVLDAVCEELDSIDHVPQWVFDRLTKKIENLPPAQPTGTPLHDNGSDYSHGFADGYKNGLKDAKSQRKGYWRHYEGYLTCSECGDEYYDDIMEYCGDNVPKFCPNCGADMREDGEADETH